MTSVSKFLVPEEQKNRTFATFANLHISKDTYRLFYMVHVD